MMPCLIRKKTFSIDKTYKAWYLHRFTWTLALFLRERLKFFVETRACFKNIESTLSVIRSLDLGAKICSPLTTDWFIYFCYEDWTALKWEFEVPKHREVILFTFA